jgi:hypothetical protein
MFIENIHYAHSSCYSNSKRFLASKHFFFLMKIQKQLRGENVIVFNKLRGPQ